MATELGDLLDTLTGGEGASLTVEQEQALRMHPSRPYKKVSLLSTHHACEK
jgi:hypothetical protein